MNSIDKLAEMFANFPGIGPRQAKRFVYFLLSKNNGYAGELIRAIENLKREIIQCGECRRFFVKNGSNSNTCSICSDDTRDHGMLMVVPRDADFEVVEKSGSYNGYYFILGGTVPILEKEPEKMIRSKELGVRIKKGLENGLKEIILAMNANLDGENTAEYLKNELSPTLGTGVLITVLGRGLSTGSELEYADPETLKNAFLHRTK